MYVYPSKECTQLDCIQFIFALCKGFIMYEKKQKKQKKAQKSKLNPAARQQQ